MNDKEREMWVNNDYGLYRWFLSSRLSMGKFIKQNKAQIDKAIEIQMNPKQMTVM